MVCQLQLPTNHQFAKAAEDSQITVSYSNSRQRQRHFQSAGDGVALGLGLASRSSTDQIEVKREIPKSRGPLPPRSVGPGIQKVTCPLFLSLKSPRPKHLHYVFPTRAIERRRESAGACVGVQAEASRQEP